MGHDSRLTLAPPVRHTLGAYELTSASTVLELEALRSVWGAFAWPDVEAQLDFFLATLDTRTDLLRPHAFAVSRDGVPQGMLLARIERTRALPAEGPLHRLRPPVVAVVVPGGVQGTPEARAVLTRALLGLTRHGRVRAICFRDCRVDGPERGAMRRALPLRAPVLSSSQRWIIDLPDAYDAYLSGLSRNLRRARRREAAALERAFGDRLVLDRYASPERVDELLRDLERVAAGGYQREQGVGFQPRHTPLVRAAFAHGLARAWVLRIDGEPVAYELGWIHGETYRGAFIGYRPDFARQAVGGYVEQAVLRELCADPTIRVYDQGQGDFTYKQRLSNRVELRTDLWAFQPTPVGVSLHLARSAYEVARWARRAEDRRQATAAAV